MISCVRFEGIVKTWALSHFDLTCRSCAGEGGDSVVALSVVEEKPARTLPLTK